VRGLGNDLAWALQRTLEDARNAIDSAVERPYPAAAVANMSDLARSNASLWL